jgi:hypothetical protein
VSPKNAVVVRGEMKGTFGVPKMPAQVAAGMRYAGSAVPQKTRLRGSGVVGGLTPVVATARS